MSRTFRKYRRQDETAQRHRWKKISVVCLICLKFFQIIIFGKSSISVFMVSGAILTFARFLKIGRHWHMSIRSVGISPPSDLYSYQEYKIYACYPLRTVVFYPDDFSPIYSIFIKFKKTEMTTICQKTEQSGFSSDSRLKKKKPSDKEPHRYICPRRTISLLCRRTKW